MTFCSSTFRLMCSESTCQLTYWRKLMQRRSRYTQPSSWSLFLFLLQTPHVRPASAPGDAPESAQEDLDLSGEEKEPAQGWLLYLETDLSSQTFWLQRITNKRDVNMKWINFEKWSLNRSRFFLLFLILRKLHKGFQSTAREKTCFVTASILSNVLLC